MPRLHGHPVRCNGRFIFINMYAAMNHELMISFSLLAFLSAELQADNDFITTNGISLGQPYNAGLDNDNQFMAYRVTLPNLKQSDLKHLLAKKY
jgi:hypothetical protein